MSQEWKEVIADWSGDSGFIGKNEAGGRVQIGTVDGQPGISPMEMLLLGVAGCTGMDIVSILAKKRQILSSFQVRVRGRRANEHPKIYTDIEVVYELWGGEIDSIAVEHAIKLSEEKFCSASAMLRATANIQSRYIIYSDNS